GDLAEDLHRYLEHLPMKHGPEPSFRERMGKFAKRHPAACGTTSIALVSILLSGLLSAGAVQIYAAFRDVYTRGKVQQFNRTFTEIQFLLNTASTSDEYLKRGLRLAAGELGHLEADTGRPILSAGWPIRLSASERRRLGEQVVELIMLEARARVAV